MIIFTPSRIISKLVHVFLALVSRWQHERPQEIIPWKCPRFPYNVSAAIWFHSHIVCFAKDNCFVFQNTSAPNCHNAMLILRYVSASDSGEFGFLVRSPNGLTEGIFNVNVTQASEYTINGAVSPSSFSYHKIFATINIIYVIFNYCYLVYWFLTIIIHNKLFSVIWLS